MKEVFILYKHYFHLKKIKTIIIIIMTHLVIDINTFFVHWLHCGLIRYKVAGSYGLGERDGRQLIRRRYGKHKHKGQRSKWIEKNWGQWLTVPVAYKKIHTPSTCHVMSLYPMCIHVMFNVQNSESLLDALQVGEMRWVQIYGKWLQEVITGLFFIDIFWENLEKT